MDFLKNKYQHELRAIFYLMWKESADSNTLGAWKCPSTLKMQTVNTTEQQKSAEVC